MFSNFEAFQKQAFELGQQLLTADDDDDSDNDLEGVDTGGFGMALSTKHHAASDSSPAQRATHGGDPAGATSHAGDVVAGHLTSSTSGHETHVCGLCLLRCSVRIVVQYTVF